MERMRLPNTLNARTVDCRHAVHTYSRRCFRQHVRVHASPEPTNSLFVFGLGYTTLGLARQAHNSLWYVTEMHLSAMCNVTSYAQTATFVPPCAGMSPQQQGAQPLSSR